MAIPFLRNFETRTYEIGCSSTGGRPTNVIIGARCKYLATMFSGTGETTFGGTSAFDVFAVLAQPCGGIFSSTAPTSAPNITTITSGFSVSTSTGTATYTYTSTASIYLSQGDILSVSGSTGSSPYMATHLVQEF